MSARYARQGREISLDGRPVAYLAGISDDGKIGELPYAIGMPADLDALAELIVQRLNANE